MSDCQENDRLTLLNDTGVSEYLTNCEAAFQLGFVPAFFEALVTSAQSAQCFQHDSCDCASGEHYVLVPRWALAMAMEALEVILIGGNISLRVKRLRRELVDYARWFALIQAQLHEDKTYDAAIESALERRKEMGDNVCIDTIEKAYKKVQKRIKEGGAEGRIQKVLFSVSDRIAALEEKARKRRRPGLG